jgi:hypothetical protein
VSGIATNYTRWIHHGEALEDMVDDDANVQDNTILPDAEGMWITQLHGMVVIRKRSRKTNTYRVWRRIKAMELMEFLN